MRTAALMLAIAIVAATATAAVEAQSTGDWFSRVDTDADGDGFLSRRELLAPPR